MLVYCLTRAKRVPEKRERLTGKVLLTIDIVTVNDPRLLRVYLQAALLQPPGDSTQSETRLPVTFAMHQSIIRITTESYATQMRGNPVIKRIVEKQIREHGTDYADYNCA